MNKVKPPFTRQKHETWIPPKHPRDEEIDRDQPPFSSGMRNRSNGDEYTKVWRR